MIFTYHTIEVCITGESCIVVAFIVVARQTIYTCIYGACMRLSPLFLGRYCEWLYCRRSAVIAGLVFSPDFWHLYDDEQKVDDDDDVVDNSIFANTAKNIALYLYNTFIYLRSITRYICIGAGHYNTLFSDYAHDSDITYSCWTIFFTIFLMFIYTYNISYKILMSRI